MMVTLITELNKSRVRIETDQDFAFVLYKGELRKYGIRQGEPISGEAWRQIREELLPKRAKLRAMNLLKTRSYTTYQLSDKLKLGGYPDNIVKEAIAYVESFGYLDDAGYAADYIEYHKEDKSRLRILNDLRRRGISEDVIQRAWEDTVGEDRQMLEREQILKLAEKRHFSLETASFDEQQKMLGFLYRKGFSLDTIRSVLLLDITPN